MYTRAKELYEIWHKQAYPTLKPAWDREPDYTRRGWYEVAAAEAKLADLLADNFKGAIHSMKAEMATMVKRKHYDDAIKSLSVCQNQIETMMLEIRRLDPKNAIAGDADIVLGLLETMIGFNPDMQTEDWKADAKAKQDVRDAEYRAAEEKRRAVMQAAMWKDDPYSSSRVLRRQNEIRGNGTYRDRFKWIKDSVSGIVNKEHKP